MCRKIYHHYLLIQEATTYYLKVPSVLPTTYECIYVCQIRQRHLSKLKSLNKENLILNIFLLLSRSKMINN